MVVVIGIVDDTSCTDEVLIWNFIGLVLGAIDVINTCNLIRSSSLSSAKTERFLEDYSLISSLHSSPLLPSFSGYALWVLHSTPPIRKCLSGKILHLVFIYVSWCYLITVALFFFFCNFSFSWKGYWHRLRLNAEMLSFSWNFAFPIYY